MAKTEISRSFMRNVISIMRDERMRPKLKRFVSILRKQQKYAFEADEFLSKENVKSDVTASFKELNDVRKGKAQLLNMDELYKELDNSYQY